MKKIRTAIIGVGSMGKNHARVLSQISNLVAVCDVDLKMARAVAQQFNVNYYTDYRVLRKQEEIDCVTIVVPTPYHYQVSKFFLCHKIPVLIEKPISNYISTAKKLLQLSKKNNTLLMVGHIERFNPVVIKAKELIQKGCVGEIISISATRVGGYLPRAAKTDVTIDLAIHDIDIVNYLLGKLPLSIKVHKQKIFSRSQPDSVMMLLKYGKTMVTIQANRVSPIKIRTLDITGSQGFLRLDYVNQQLTYHQSIFDQYQKYYQNPISELTFTDYIKRLELPKSQQIKVDTSEPLLLELNYYLTLVRNKEVINSSYAYQALKIAKQ